MNQPTKGVLGEHLELCSRAERLRLAAYESYQKHCGPRAVECAEGDLLGKALEACKAASDCLRLLPVVFHVAQAQGELVIMCERALREITVVIAKAKGEKP